MSGKKNGKRRKAGGQIILLGGVDLTQKAISAKTAVIMPVIMDLVNILDRLKRMDEENQKKRLQYPVILEVMTGLIAEVAKVQGRIRAMNRMELESLLDVLNGCLNTKHVSGPMAGALLQVIWGENLPVVGHWNRPFVERIARVARRRLEAMKSEDEGGE